MSGQILTPDCPMCGTPMPTFGLLVIVPICMNESCPVIQWNPDMTIAQNRANATVVEDPFSTPEPFRSGDS